MFTLWGKTQQAEYNPTKKGSCSNLVWTECNRNTIIYSSRFPWWHEGEVRGLETKLYIDQSTAVLTELNASSNPQQGSRHVVKRKSDVDDVIRCGSTDREEGHTHDGLQVPDASRLGETWRRTATQMVVLKWGHSYTWALTLVLGFHCYSETWCNNQCTARL